MITVTGAASDDVLARTAIARCARELLAAADVTPEYRAALHMALAMPGNILSDAPDARWVRLVWTCCTAAGGHWEQVIPVAAAAEIFMVALDVLDDEEDGEVNPLHGALGAARALNVSTGLLLLAQQSLWDLDDGATMARLLLTAGLHACAGQHADLAPQSERCIGLNAALTIAAEKSASLVAALCRLGALCAGADASLQERYGRFGRNVGMVAQLANDIAAMRPDADGKTDITLARPTLPLTYTTLFDRTAAPGGDDAIAPSDPWHGGAGYLTLAVADTYRRYALDLIPHLTDDHVGRAALAALLDDL